MNFNCDHRGGVSAEQKAPPSGKRNALLTATPSGSLASRIGKVVREKFPKAGETQPHCPAVQRRTLGRTRVKRGSVGADHQRKTIPLGTPNVNFLLPFRPIVQNARSRPYYFEQMQRVGERSSKKHLPWVDRKLYCTSMSPNVEKLSPAFQQPLPERFKD
jgi:hypothetical protein